MNDDTGRCTCCMRVLKLRHFSSKYGWYYCQECYDAGCEIGRAFDSCALPSRYGLPKAALPELDTDEQLGIDNGPSAAEMAEAIAAIRAVGT